MKQCLPILKNPCTDTDLEFCAIPQGWHKTPKLKENAKEFGIFFQHGTLFALSLSLSLI